ncbi:MAG: regulatory iron-sulfur-containing complex subunit RicT [Planctomycetota bacterium]|nr:regulatory iron-sulfur-containing complex subunit RicT [Planctomycetota bacterium]
MPGSITPLPIFAELDAEDRATYAKLEAPKSIVVRYGSMKLIAELPYDGEAKPGCGSKLVIRTSRGIELGEMLTTTCGNAGCGKSVSRKQMLEYIDNSGGRDYPFTTQGRVLRVATIEDLNNQSALEARRTPMIKFTKALVTELNLPMKLVDVELLLGMERIIFHYTSEDWVDFRDMVQRLATEYRTRIEMHQVNARDEARLVADYEKCGQQCCCKQFLKVLKPVSMRSAKVQKATLDPTKISGRCGRLMCCLRYEDETYESLRKKLPKKNSRVTTPDGPGTILDTQILTQLALCVVDNVNGTAAYPIENLEPLAREDDPMYNQPKPALGGPAVAGGPQGGSGGQPRGNAGPPQRGGARPERGGPGQPAGTGGGPGGGASGGQRTGESRQGGPGRDDRPRRDNEPRRPKPGAPLRENEVESREGKTGDDAAGDGDIANKSDVPQAPRPQAQADSRPPVAKAPMTPRPPAPRQPDAAEEMDDQEDGEADGPETGADGDGAATGAPGEVGAGGQAAPGDGGVGPDGEPRKRRRRRRRGRGRGRGGQGGPGGPESQGGSGGPPSGGGGGPSGPA